LPFRHRITRSSARATMREPRLCSSPSNLPSQHKPTHVQIRQRASKGPSCGRNEDRGGESPRRKPLGSGRTEATRDSATAAHVAGRDFVSHRVSKSLSIFENRRISPCSCKCPIEKTQLFWTRTQNLTAARLTFHRCQDLVGRA
jgi:hypothetical protein